MTSKNQPYNTQFPDKLYPHFRVSEEEVLLYEVSLLLEL